jgi:hypothetical protein
MTERPRGRRSGYPDAALLVPAHDELGNWRHQRSGGHDRLAGGVQAARDAAPCPSTKWRRASSRPYSAISAIAIDRSSSDVAAAPEFAAIGGEASLLGRSRPARSRAAVAVDRLRRGPSLKRQALRSAFERFVELVWHRQTSRATALTSFVAEQAVDRGILAVSRRPRRRASVPGPSAGRPPLSRARGSSRRTSGPRQHVLFHQPSWIARTQWRQARERTHGVALFGDLPRHGGRRQRRRLGAPASSFISMSPLARRRMRSAPQGRTGECPSTDGT